MRKPYATPEQYEHWRTEELKLYAGKLAYITMVMIDKHGVNNALDRHILGNLYDELRALKTLLDARIASYASKLLLERLLGILESEFAAYDKRGREARLARKQQEATMRLLYAKENIA